jgi:hypothetical protein
MLHDLVCVSKLWRDISHRHDSLEVEECSTQYQATLVPGGTVTRWYGSIDGRRSLLNLAACSHSDDILAVALASENLCETSPCAGCKSAPPDAGTRNGYHFRPT